MTLSGQVMDLFGPQPVYFQHLQAAFGNSFPWHNWSYPPHYLLLVWPLGFFGYEAAMMLFLGSTAALFVWALREFVGRGNVMTWVAVGPFVAHNFWVAQNGFLSAGLALGALALRERRPVLAGVLLGVLTIKPQLGLLFPFLLLAERRWSMIASAGTTAVALVGLSAAIFGIDAWKGYVNEVLPYQAFVMRELEDTFTAMLPSVYGTSRNSGVETDLALLFHLVVAVPVAAVTIWAFFSAKQAQDRANLLLIGLFLITPYALTYDLGLFAAPLALLAVDNRQGSATSSRETTLLAVAMLLPTIMMPLGYFNVPIASVVILGVFLLALRRAGLRIWRPGTSVERGPAFTEVPSPAAASD
ncbi:glycosyltransferase family 87 protein [Pseudaminobacter soli (ex Li et al. 2025)]|uniref:glycosyltransferase family 87 protein n=1 Tax=Pseudaminobacter soli (ex Li et al. 2025) TaxID=1295366 RepID=UPI0024747970|nr:glycosyltransferase family 87 protein [Mesorhizobium soli]